MTTAVLNTKKKATINVDGINAIAEKFDKINKLIEDGKPLSPELTKNFVTVSIPNNPFEGFE